VLQSVAVCEGFIDRHVCGMLERTPRKRAVCIAGCCRVLQGVAGCCRVLHGVAVCCSVLQGVAGCCGV